MNRNYKPLTITPNGNSAVSHASINHDRYFAEFAFPREVQPRRLAHLSNADNLVLRRCKLRQRERSAAVQLLRADAHLGAET